MIHPEMRALRCVIMRGGTCKVVVFMESELPKDQKQRDAVLLGAYGSPDSHQLDGLGGADPMTSKLAIIGPSTRPDADVDFTYGQISLTMPVVDYQGNCGNTSAVVGPFAIDEGLVRAVEPVTTVRVHLTNSGNILTLEVPVKDGRAAVEGDTVVDGCPGTGACITLDWADTAGAFTGSILPTGNVKDVIRVDGKDYTVSLVDCANALVFIKAEELGLEGTEKPAQLAENKSLLKLIEKIRCKAAVIFKFIKNEEEGALKSAYLPFFSIVSAPQGYTALNGKTVDEGAVDIVSRLVVMGRAHQTHPGTATVCLGAAAHIPGSVVDEVLRSEARERLTIRIGHPSGIVPVEAKGVMQNGVYHLERAAMYRTARRIMDGQVYVRNKAFEG